MLNPLEAREEIKKTSKLGVSVMLGVACLAAVSPPAAGKPKEADFNATGSVTLADPAYNAGAMLSNIHNSGPAGDMLTVTNAFNAYTGATMTSEIRKVAPVTNASIANPAIATGSASVGLSESRLANLRGDTSLASTGDIRGMAAGDAAKNSAFWVKGLGGFGSQGAKDGFDGYKARTYGIGFGADTRLASDWIAGLSYTYGDTKVDQQDFRSGDTNKVISNQLTAYAGRDFGPAYIDLMLAYGDLSFDTKRATALGRIATGSYRGDLWVTKVGGGYKMPMGGGNNLIPMASLQYSSLAQKSYTETDAGALNLSYNGQTTTRTQSNLGFRFTNDSKTGGGGDLKLEGRFGWLHDFNDSGTDTMAAFSGGGGAFTTNGQKITKNGWTLGAGAGYTYGSGTSVSLQYDYEGRSGYKANSVQMVGRWAF